MIKKILFLVTLSTLLGVSFHSQEARAQARMVDKGLEYISAASQTIFKVFYNIYVHPNEAKHMFLDQYDSRYIETKTRIVNQGRLICGQNANVDECHVYFWTDLMLIPPVEDMPNKNFKLAAGHYTIGVDTQELFNWNENAEDYRQKFKVPLDPRGAVFKTPDDILEEDEDNVSPESNSDDIEVNDDN